MNLTFQILDVSISRFFRVLFFQKQYFQKCKKILKKIHKYLEKLPNPFDTKNNFTCLNNDSIFIFSGFSQIFENIFFSKKKNPFITVKRDTESRYKTIQNFERFVNFSKMGKKFQNV